MNVKHPTGSFPIENIKNGLKAFLFSFDDISWLITRTST